MHPSANVFFNSTISDLLKENQLIIPHRVMRELKRLKKVKRGSKMSEKQWINKKNAAKKAITIVKKMKNESKAIVKGEEKDFADDHRKHLRYQATRMADNT